MGIADARDRAKTVEGADALGNAGLAFAIKEAVGTEEIRRREHDFARRALA